MTNTEMAPCQQKTNGLFKKIQEALERLEKTIQETKEKLTNGQYEKYIHGGTDPLGGQ